jgi:hypothetical protein
MRVHHVAALLGIALGTGLGVAIGSSPGAVADPIVDDWPDLSQLMTEFTTLF